MRLVSQQHWSHENNGIIHPLMFCLVPIFFLLFILLAACGSSSPTNSGTGVSTLDNAYSPRELHIKVGDTVTWVNNGQTSHSVTADDNSFDSGLFNPGTQYSHKFTKPGHYSYYCTLHGGPGGSGMAGVIIVDSSTTLAPANSIMRPTKVAYAILRVPEEYPTIQKDLFL